MAPGYLEELVVRKSSSRSLRSSGELVVNRTKIDGDRGFAVYGPRLWNQLPGYIREVEDIATIKRLARGPEARKVLAL
jgi:hypothetical protein